MKGKQRTMKLYSWNVNGVRAVYKKGFLDWHKAADADVVCLQETKARPDQLDQELIKVGEYQSYWCSAERKGYSGVAAYTRRAPVQVMQGFGNSAFDAEGRVLVAEFPQFFLFNVYFPNGKKSQERLDYKMSFYQAIFRYWQELRSQGKKLVICGDYNTAHKEIDLARPKENQNVSGFLQIERDWMDLIVKHGFVDTFRLFNQLPNQYTWWDMVTRARERNVGWRLDYFFVTEDLVPQVRRAWISPEVMGSDHCPVGLELEI